MTAVSFSDGQVIVSFSSANVHRSVGTPGVDTGSVWSQPATLTLTGVVSTQTPSLLPATVADGLLRIGSLLHANVIPASGVYEGPIELSIILSTGEALTIRGKRIRSQLLGD